LFGGEPASALMKLPGETPLSSRIGSPSNQPVRVFTAASLSVDMAVR
jgi:hypothetical protein